jgi:DNA repair protein RecO (recombination protein O)
MIRWKDKAFILHVAPLSERDVLVELLTHTHGRLRTVAKFGATSKKRTIYQVGNRVTVEWSARLSSHMGHVNAEIEQSYMPLFLNDASRLLMMHSAHALCHQFLYEHDRAEAVFEGLSRWYEVTVKADLATTAKYYALFEYTLLGACGYGLDLFSCAATGTTKELVYISPKSGRAVSREAGRPYHEKLFVLPRCYLEEHEDMPLNATLQALTLNGFFMESRLCEKGRTTLPDVRHRLIHQLEKVKNFETHRVPER